MNSCECIVECPNAFYNMGMSPDYGKDMNTHTQTHGVEPQCFIAFLLLLAFWLGRFLPLVHAVRTAKTHSVKPTRTLHARFLRTACARAL